VLQEHDQDSSTGATISQIVAVLLHAGNVFLGLVVRPRFAAVFDEMLAGEPLPAVTCFLLGPGGMLLVGVSVLCIALAVLAPLFISTARTRTRLNLLLCFVAVMMFGIHVVALFLPMIKLVDSLSN